MSKLDNVKTAINIIGIAWLIISIALLQTGYINIGDVNRFNQIARDIAKEEIDGYLNKEIASSISLLEKSCSYIIDKVGSYTYAINGTTGKLWTYNTDSSTVINAAIKSLSEGGTLFFKVANYTINTKITLKNKVSMIGEYVGVSANGSDVYGVAFIANASIAILEPEALAHYNRVENIGFDGKSTGLIAINLTETYYFTLRNFVIIHFVDHGIKINDKVQNCIFEMGAIGDGKNNVYIEGSSLVTYLDFRNIWMGHSSQNCFHVNGYVKKVKIDMCTFTYGDPIAIYIHSGRLIRILGSHFENSDNESIWIRSGACYQIEGCVFSNSGHSHLLLGTNGYKVYDIKVTNNYMITTGATYPSIRLDYRGSINGFFANNEIINSGNDIGIDISGSTSADNTVIIGYTDDKTPISNAGTQTKCIGKKFQNSGIERNIADGGTIAHGLMGKPTMVQLTSLNITNRSENIFVAWNETATDATNIVVRLYYANCTSVSQNEIDVSWYAEYVP